MWSKSHTKIFSFSLYPSKALLNLSVILLRINIICTKYQFMVTTWHMKTLVPVCVVHPSFFSVIFTTNTRKSMTIFTFRCYRYLLSFSGSNNIYYDKFYIELFFWFYVLKIFVWLKIVKSIWSLCSQILFILKYRVPNTMSKGITNFSPFGELFGILKKSL